MDIIELSDVDTYDEESFLNNTSKLLILKNHYSFFKINQLDFNIQMDNDDEIKETDMAYFTKNLGVLEVVYTTVPIEYPATSPDGVATVFSIQGWKNAYDAFNDVNVN